MSYTVTELARRWQCHQETIRRMIQRGDLKAFRVGKQWRIPQEAVTWIETKQPQRLPKAA